MSSLKIIETKDGSHSLLNESLNETYHSTHGAIQESAHVFIKNGLEYFVNENNCKSATIFEVGFGTGLNVLLTLKFATESKIKINYQSIESAPVNEGFIAQLNYTDLISLSEGKTQFEKIHQCRWNEQTEISNYFELKKIFNSIHDINLTAGSFEIIFFDAFAPAKQPDMWVLPVLGKVIEGLKPNGVFVTYCAKGQLKRDLKSLGLTVESLPGPPGKREMVRAVKS